MMTRELRNTLLLVPSLLLACASCDHQQSNDPRDGVATSSAALQTERVGSELVATPLELPRRTANGNGDDTSESTGRETLFELLTPDRTGVDFQMQLPDPIKYIKELMFLNPYGGIATGDFDADGLADFFVTCPVSGGRLYRNLGSMRFEDVTAELGVGTNKQYWGSGVTFADVNNDGRLDLYVCSYLSPNKLFINTPTDGGVKFEERAREYGLDYRGASMTMAFADIDNDGDLDGYLATTSKAPPPGTNFRVRFENGKPIVLDHLKEYWQLIYLPGDRAKRTEAGQYDHLYRNDGGKFTEITKEAGIDGPYFTLSATWWDYNGDNLPDLYVSNDYTGPDMLYENLGDGKFKDVVRDVIPHTPWFSMGADSGDINNDGLIDLMAVDMSATTHYREKVMMGNMEDTSWFLDFAQPRQYMRNAVYLNTGASRVMEAAFMAGLASTDWTWTPRIADFDNDGRLDVFFTNGILRDAMNSDLSAHATESFEDGSPQWANFWANQPIHPEVNHAFKNAGDLRFRTVAKEWGLDRKGVSFGAATADFDNDGDLDLVVSNVDAPVSVYKNNSVHGNRLRVALIGTRSNRSGIGATVRIEAGGERQVQYVTLARGWLSSCEPTVHFGLGVAEKVDRLTIEWPSGVTQVLTDVDANTICTITESQETPNVVIDRQEPSWFVSSDLLRGVKHSEVPFDDFKDQPLLPNRLSRSGPAMAWADVDDDGREDFFLGGSRGEPGQLYVSGLVEDRYTRSRSVPFAVDAACEDIDAVFFDADGDGDRDLYVVSGSNEAPVGDESYRDRLYVNDGGGQFKKSQADTLPSTRVSGSVVVACDFDLDGDEDLFVGARSIPGRYPETSECQMLTNDNGKFVDHAPTELAKAGLVTSAIWCDVNADETPDLVVATEWGPVRLFMNESGQLVDRTEAANLASLSGWWSSLDAGDIDHDGDIDLVATNFGLNTKYKASPEKPELLYYGDVDGSGAKHIIEAKFEGRTCYPRRGFSCSSNAMPLLRKRVDTFHEFAISPLAGLYGDERLSGATRLEANELQSGVFINDGSGGFTFRPLPRIAQIAPSMDVCLVDLDRDTHLDIVMAQNFYGPQRETGHMDGGVGLVLRGDGNGEFVPCAPAECGIVVGGDARRVTATDINDDGLLDVVFAVNDGPMAVFTQRNRAEQLARRQNQ